MKIRETLDLNIILRTTLAFLFLTAWAGLKAEKTENKFISLPVTGTYALEIGGENILSTYLSPLHYSGSSWGISGHWTKAMPFNPEKAVMEFNVRGRLNSLLNPAQTASMMAIYGSFSWGMSWRKRICHDIQITAGGALQIAGGAYYLIRNSNNPVQALAQATLDLTASISKTFKIGKLPVLFSDRIQIPSLGIFFCPQYGETYYEIYLGNYKDLVHPGWWGNNFRIDNLLSFTLDFGKTAMTLGYRLSAFNQWANNLNTKILTNSFVIGVVPHGIGLKKNTRKLPEETIYAIY